MSSKILSIVVPTYNMEELLPYCLESFLIKRNIDKLEVVIVNDGSKDSSLSIAESYRERFPDTFRIIDKKTAITDLV